VEELGQLVIAVIFILFYALSASKKKKKKPVPPAVRKLPQQPVHTVAPPVVTVESDESEREPPTVPADWQIPDSSQKPIEKPVERKRSLAEELLGMLQEQAMPVPAPTDQLYEVDDEAQSLETLEPDGSRSDERIHHHLVVEVPAESPYAVEDSQAPKPYAVEETPEERPYVVEETLAPQPYSIPDAPKRKRDLTRSELRHAFVMREVLGPPKALED
jgi:hypothetical protein